MLTADEFAYHIIKHFTILKGKSKDLDNEPEPFNVFGLHFADNLINDLIQYINGLLRGWGTTFSILKNFI